MVPVPAPVLLSLLSVSSFWPFSCLWPWHDLWLPDLCVICDFLTGFLTLACLTLSFLILVPWPWLFPDSVLAVTIILRPWLGPSPDSWLWRQVPILCLNYYITLPVSWPWQMVKSEWSSLWAIAGSKIILMYTSLISKGYQNIEKYALKSGTRTFFFFTLSSVLGKQNLFHWFGKISLYFHFDLEIFEKLWQTKQPFFTLTYEARQENSQCWYEVAYKLQRALQASASGSHIPFPLPEIYDEDKQCFREFLIQHHLSFLTQPRTYSRDQEKVSLVISLWTGDTLNGAYPLVKHNSPVLQD